jgi:hypothetical protein
MRRVFAAFLLLSLFALAGRTAFAHAQTSAYAEIASVDARGFPQISALVDIYEGDGKFMDGLRPRDLTVYEDGEERPVDTLATEEIPLQLVVAINPGPSLAVRDASAVQRFTKIVETLSAWVNALPTDSDDDLSLVSLSGSLITHAGARDWFVSLDSFKPDFRNTTPNLQTFSIALDTVTAPTPQPGMKRGILFITPHMDDPAIDTAIGPLIQQAVDARVRVFVWFVDGEAYFNTASANAFRSLALQTSGSFFAFSGAEVFPDLEAEFEPLRQIYSLTYTSALNTSGDHTFEVEVETPEGTVDAPEESFAVEIQPPNPILVTPPLQIKREPPADDPYNGEVLLPEKQTIEILVEFPDGHPRDITRTALYVDGEMVDENTSEPFESFIWDLTPYDASGQHEIIAEAEDALGLKKSSISIPVTLTVIQPPTGIQAFLARYRSYVVLGAIGSAGIALLAIVLLGRPGLDLFKKRRQTRKQFDDPLTQPVVAVTEPPTSPINKPKPAPRRGRWLQLPAPHRATRLPDAPAYLRRLTNGGEPASSLPIPLLEPDLTFGTDPVQSVRVLDDPSIAPLHARIKQKPDGSFFIYDHGSVAGTWVNYEPVTREGRRLTHGDCIHLGRLMYRFDLKQPPAEPEPKIISQRPAS